MSTKKLEGIDKIQFVGGWGLHALAIIAIILLVISPRDSFAGWNIYQTGSIMFAIMFCIGVMFIMGSKFIERSLPTSRGKS
jgi:hypothetical protein